MTDLRTGAWYHDEALELDFPPSWDVTTHRPRTPPALEPAQLAASLASPVGRPRLRELAAGRTSPVIVVDDLTRPTPADHIVPLILDELREASVDPASVTIVVATGTHGAPGRDAVLRKVGPEAAKACRVLIHDDRSDLVRVGRTSFGTAVRLNRAVAAADLVLGIGGIYPQHSVGFGGGSKLALGVLGRSSIASLHYGHPSMDGAYETDNDFRRDLDEIARMIGLIFVCSTHVNAQREIVRLVCGDPTAFHADEVDFAKSAFAAPLPGDADIVVSNTFPMDVSVTFMRSKGATPLLSARPEASKILIAACTEGLGHHGLYPFVGVPRFDGLRQVVRTIQARPGSVPRKVVDRVRSQLRRSEPTTALGTVSAFPIHLLATRAPDLPAEIRGMVVHRSWESVLRTIEQEQTGSTSLKVVVYPCAPLQVLSETAAEAELDVAA